MVGDVYEEVYWVVVVLVEFDEFEGFVVLG